ncbi:MAG: hypothetical protein AB2788_15205, partial [Candidatus Thiodiazotropha endolucinida]
VASPIYDITELYTHINKLSTDITNLLFYPGTEPGMIPVRRRQDIFKVVGILSKRADLDAFTALIGLLQEDSILNKNETPIVHFLSIKPTLTAFRRLIYHPPFPEIAHDLFDYLSDRFPQELKSDYAKDLIDRLDISLAIEHSEFLISLVERLNILQKFSRPPVSCMHIIERYMSKKTLTMALTMEIDDDLSTLKKVRDINNLTRALRRWELKQTNYSTIPWS